LGKPKLKVFSNDELRCIHDSSLEILERIGVNITSNVGIKILERAGAEVQGKLVKIPSYLVKESIKKAPKHIKLYGREKERICIGKDNDTIYFKVSGIATNYLDLNNGRRRQPLSKDLASVVRLIDYLKNIHFLQPPLAPIDHPPKIKTERYAFLVTLENTTKHISAEAYNSNDVQTILKVGAKIAGNEEEFKKNPVFSIIICTVSPLIHEAGATSTLIEAAKHKIPIIVSSGPLSGATSPATLAGTMVQVNAELLSALTIAEMTANGAPFVYVVSARSMDMRTGNIANGGPEYGLLRICGAQLGKYYDLPTGVSGLLTDSKIPDIQAGYEAMMSGIMGALSGADFIMGCSLKANNAISCEFLIICNEIAGYISRIINGVEVDQETLALPSIKEAISGRSFIAMKHTLKFVPKEHYVPLISDRSDWKAWEKEGCRTLHEAAKELAKKIISTHKPKSLEKNEEIKRIIEEGENLK